MEPLTPRTEPTEKKMAISCDSLLDSLWINLIQSKQESIKIQVKSYQRQYHCVMVVKATTSILEFSMLVRHYREKVTRIVTQSLGRKIFFLTFQRQTTIKESFYQQKIQPADFRLSLEGGVLKKYLFIFLPHSISHSRLRVTSINSSKTASGITGNNICVLF